MDISAVYSVFQHSYNGIALELGSAVSSEPHFVEPIRKLKGTVSVLYRAFKNHFHDFGFGVINLKVVHFISLFV